MSDLAVDLRPMKPPVIFDLDGTLVDSCAICVEILSDMLAERGSAHVIDPVGARPWMSVGGQRMVAALLGPACGDPETEIADFRGRYAEKQTRRETLFPHVADGLARLAEAGHRLAICSNKPQNLVDKVLADTALASLFSSVVGARTGLATKPAPDLMLAVLSELGRDAADCIFVGDSEVDDAAARGMGMPFLFVTYGYAAEHYTPLPERSYDCFGALTEDLVRGRHHA
ncbi:MAG: HAD-IA family hydrolase [Sphingomonadales bacterium]|nr:HAD-IA family hydrolase [Sphingomonadales bacterium]